MSTEGTRGTICRVNGKASRETQMRLKHALDRLGREPRRRERRLGERRCAALVLLPVGEERRSYGDRRRAERRASEFVP
jgi:hypothetical protein